MSDDPLVRTVHDTLMELWPDAYGNTTTGDWTALRDDAEYITARIRDTLRKEGGHRGEG